MSALSYVSAKDSVRSRLLQPAAAPRRSSFGYAAPGTQAQDPAALLRAAESGDARLIRRLLENGADINISDAQGWTPLMKAAKNHHLKAVAELITSGANLNAETRNGWNALSIAVKAGSPQIIALLASTGGKTAKG